MCLVQVKLLAAIGILSARLFRAIVYTILGVQIYLYFQQNVKAILKADVRGASVVDRLENDQPILTKKDRCTMTALLVGYLVQHHGLK